jgi:cytochrome c
MFKKRLPYWACIAGIVVIACKQRDGYRSVPPAVTETYTFHSEPSADWPARFGYGRKATGKEMAAQSLAIRPDGTGLPEGSGNVKDGAAIYAAQCASCHGITGTEGPFNVLVAPDTITAVPFDQAPRRIKAIGNYWPYATTIFDYVRRAMPFNAPGSLSDHEVYSVTAFLLYANRIIPEDAVINANTLPVITMPAKKYYITDNRKGGKGPYE